MFALEVMILRHLLSSHQGIGVMSACLCGPYRIQQQHTNAFWNMDSKRDLSETSPFDEPSLLLVACLMGSCIRGKGVVFEVWILDADADRVNVGFL